MSCGASSCPTIRAGIVSPACVRFEGGIGDVPALDDHLATGPNCRMQNSVSGREQGVVGYPGIISTGAVRYFRKRIVTTTAGGLSGAVDISRTLRTRED